MIFINNIKLTKYNNINLIKYNNIKLTKYNNKKLLLLFIKYKRPTIPTNYNSSSDNRQLITISIRRGCHFQIFTFFRSNYKENKVEKLINKIIMEYAS